MNQITSCAIHRHAGHSGRKAGVLPWNRAGSYPCSAICLYQIASHMPTAPNRLSKKEDDWWCDRVTQPSIAITPSVTMRDSANTSSG